MSELKYGSFVVGLEVQSRFRRNSATDFHLVNSPSAEFKNLAPKKSSLLRETS